MKKAVLISFCFFIFGFNIQAQTLNSIFTNVDTIGLDPNAAPGALAVTGINAVPLASTHCTTNIDHYAAASTHNSGRIIVMGHEGFLTDNSLGLYDNLTFISQAMNWLSNGNTSANITIKNGWINGGNTTMLQNELQNMGYSISSTNNSITSLSLSNTDILILGNDWNGNSAYNTVEKSIINNFISYGGGVLVVGLGWSWPGSLSNYPMHNIASLYGIDFTTDIIQNNTFTNLHPIDTAYINCPSEYFNTNISRGDTLRVIRLAVSATGEFTQENGGVINTSNLIKSWLEEINDIYGREYAVRFKLVQNNNAIVFPNAASDPWATMPLGSGGCNNSGVIMADQQHVIDSIIGSSNYDVSHVILSPQHLGGGCAGSYTSGISGGLNIPVTRHEIGHQFWQSHTINHTGRDNYEPENGNWTIQGGNGHAYAHGVSFHELALNLLNNPLVGQKELTGNTIPEINAGDDVTIPISTPFTLKASSFDPDSEDSLTYVWDNMDKGYPQFIPVTDDLKGAIFMRLLPTSESSRTFPKIEDVIANNNSNNQEQLPTQPRVMNIRVTVNDNHKMNYLGEWINASGINSDDISITVDESGPFVVTSQNTSGLVYNGGSSYNVTWDVNGTNVLPVNATDVKISLSTDGGYTFSTVLLNSTPNDGSQLVELPYVNTTEARIKVEAVDNIFFDINTHNFSIESNNIGITTVLDHKYWISPNPVKETLYVNTTNEHPDYVLRLTDINGKLLLENKNAKSISLTSYSSGIYFIEIQDVLSGQVIRERFVKLN